MPVTTEAPRDELIAYRRHFHAHPELSLKEFETAAFIEGELRAREFDEIRTSIGTTGILATLQGGKAGPVTLLRADMDALPIVELNDATYRSTRNGAIGNCPGSLYGKRACCAPSLSITWRK